MKKVGILTFHCADNCGAMLQAYGLKRYLNKKGTKADIIDYEPFFMTGRHWWIPYIPAGNIVKSIKIGLYGWKNNLKIGKIFFRKRTNMKWFRKEYLIEKKQRKIFFSYQMRSLPYQYYIVGSDQIWNPDITCGLRKVYFGGFKNRNKQKVIAYAASLGGPALSEQYNKEFSDLIKNVDAVSVRESAAIMYIKQFYSGKIFAVPDPVFLLNKKEWEKIERLPDQDGYVVVYVTENNSMLSDYVKTLAKNHGLSIIRIENRIRISDEGLIVDYLAGPSEFLGYIHKADYVVTNSFHAIAFSIIYHKKFVAFQHSSVGERITNVLRYYGLEDRLYQGNINVKIDDMIDWDSIEEKIKKSASAAEEFLMKNMEQ